MIIKDHKLLFIHIPKNAGKSIESALSGYNKKQLNMLGRRRLLNRLSTFLQRKTVNLDSIQNLHGTLDVSLCAQHLTLQEIILLGFQIENDFRKFAIVRNPFDRALSTFRHWHKGTECNADSFENFCFQWFKEVSSNHNEASHKRRQIDFLRCLDGEVKNIRILRYENLADDFSLMCSDWDIKGIKLPHIGNNKSTVSYEFQDIYNNTTKNFIEEYFKEDLKLFDYGYPSSLKGGI